MRELSEIIYGILSADAGLIAVVGNKIFPLLADQNIKEPFITYNLREEPKYSKEGKLEYTVTVSSFHNTYNDVCDLGDLVKEALLVNSDKYFAYEGGQPYYNEEKQLSVVQSYGYMSPISSETDPVIEVTE